MDKDKLIASIQLGEGLRLKPYVDSVGKITIGYGRNLTDKGISTDEADALLNNDIMVAFCEAEDEPWWPNVINNDARSRALVEMIFNMGLGRFHGFVNAIACLMNNDFTGAAANFMDSLWAKQVHDRAVRLTQMIATGEG